MDKSNEKATKKRAREIKKFLIKANRARKNKWKLEAQGIRDCIVLCGDEVYEVDKMNR